MENNFLSRFQSTPVLIAPEMIAKVKSQLLELDKVQSEDCQHKGDFWENDDGSAKRNRPYQVQSGVLSIPVTGVLMNRLNETYGFATGYEYILQAVRRGDDDPEVNGIALMIDSPGGTSAGLFDLTDRIASRESDKPIHAFVLDGAYSAAYAIASTADRITAPRSGGVGSIGVVSMHVDISSALEKDGIKVTFVHAGKHKVDGNMFQPLPEDVQNRMQERVNLVYQDFVSTVARNRSMSEQQVRDTEAQVFTAEEGVSKGLADEVAPIDDAVAAFAASLFNSNKTLLGGTTMSKEQDHAAVSLTADKQTLIEAHKEGANAEKDRIRAILSLDEAEGREDSAKSFALDTDLTTEQTKKLLASIPKKEAKVDNVAAATSPFEAAMNSSDNPNVGKGDENSLQEESQVDIVLRDYRAATGCKKHK